MDIEPKPLMLPDRVRQVLTPALKRFFESLSPELSFLVITVMHDVPVSTPIEILYGYRWALCGLPEYTDLLDQWIQTGDVTRSPVASRPSEIGGLGGLDRMSVLVGRCAARPAFIGSNIDRLGIQD